ncbi:MAG TPA: DUF3000 domain-containing protein [Mycobacteriales bacterium]|nr:DUF3000 domain-containing protein [Mycobacteriales bacterium]
MTVEPDEAPEAFRSAVADLRATEVDVAVTIREIPAPGRLAPYSFALAAEVLHGDDELAGGRFVLLHDPAGQDAWEGTSRIVAFLSAEVEEDIGNDPLLPEVGWAWLLDALAGHDAGHVAAGGTVTRTSSSRFGMMAGEDDGCDVELRCSWTPTGPSLGAHLAAFCDVLCSMAGLPPASAGVARLPLGRSRS